MLRSVAAATSAPALPCLPPRYVRHIEEGYLDHPYHCATHAADVLQTLHVLLHRGRLVEHYCGGLGGVHLLAAYMAAVSSRACRRHRRSRRHIHNKS